MTRILAIALVVGSCGKSAPPPPQTLHVEIHGMQFVPGSLRVHRGDIVVFTNHDLVPHTATSAGWFDSGPISPNQSWTYVVTDSIDYDYVCSMHPTMKGQLTAH